jgi:hypothetical protein
VSNLLKQSVVRKRHHQHAPFHPAGGVARRYYTLYTLARSLSFLSACTFFYTYIYMRNRFPHSVLYASSSLSLFRARSVHGNMFNFLKKEREGDAALGENESRPFPAHSFNGKICAAASVVFVVGKRGLWEIRARAFPASRFIY